jgi:hypothetical protein
LSFAIALSNKLRYIESLDVHENKGYWYPSDLAFCDRKAVLAHAGLEETPKDDISLRRLWLGEKIHDAIKGAHPYEVIGHEVRVRDEEYKVSGKMDTLARTPDGYLEVDEYKSISSRSFTYNDLPKPEHVLQVGVYLLFPASCPHEGKEYLKKPKGKIKGQTEWTPPPQCPICGAIPVGGIHNKLSTPDWGRLIYISKDDLRIDEFIIRMDENLEHDIKEKLVRLEELYQRYMKDGTLPDPLPLVPKVVRGKETLAKPWQFRYCDFRGTGKCCGDNIEGRNATDTERTRDSEGSLPQGQRDTGDEIREGSGDRSQGGERPGEVGLPVLWDDGAA